MELTEDEYWYWFTNIARVGRRTRSKLLNVFESPKDIYFAPENVLSELDFLTQVQKNNILARDEAGIKKEFENIKKQGIGFLYPGICGYPERLLYIPDPPHALYFIGNPDTLGRPQVSIVGSRKCSDYGRNAAYNIAKELASYGIHIVSGLACGIDGSAQRGCVDAGGITHAVLGCGVDICYPQSNIELYMMIKQTGSIISEYPPHTKPNHGFFPERNRIISGLSDIVIIVEAGEKSGSLITADCALEQGKDVFAVPGRITDSMSTGCNTLIKNGAALYDNIYEILDMFSIERDDNGKSECEKNNFLATDEKIVYANLCFEPKHISRIAAETQKPVEDIMRTVLHLETRHIIRQTANNYYVKL